MHLKVTIDGQLVGQTETDAAGHLYVFHEYGRWSLVAVATSAEARRVDADGGTGRVTVEQLDTLAELATAVDDHGGPGTWTGLLDRNRGLQSIVRSATHLRALPVTVL